MSTVIKPYTKAELATLYNISAATLYRWITGNNILDEKDLQEYKSCKIVKTPLVQKIFNSKIGFPEL